METLTTVAYRSGVNRELMIKVMAEIEVQSRPRTSRQLHSAVNPHLETPVELDETVAALEALRDAGRIVLVGGSSQTKWRLAV